MLRYHRCCEEVSSNASFVQLHQIPPTSEAANLYSLLMYLLVQDWLNNASSCNPEGWGWINKSWKLFPLTASMPAGPAKLLEVIGCSCKSRCDTRRYTCQQNDLQCSTACGNCHGASCSNAQHIHIELEDDC